MNSKLIVVFIFLFSFFNSIESSSSKSKGKNVEGKRNMNEKEIMSNIIKTSTSKPEFVDTLTESLKNEYLRILPQPSFIGSAAKEKELHKLAALFHYKTLAWEILRDFDKDRKELMGRKDRDTDNKKIGKEMDKEIDKIDKEMDNKELDNRIVEEMNSEMHKKKMNEEFWQRLNFFKMEHVNLNIFYRDDENWEGQLCTFYKFLPRMNYDEKLTSNKDWNAYFHHKLRHFIWIDFFTLAGISDMKKMELDLLDTDMNLEGEKIKCNDEEVLNVKKYTQRSPQIERAHFWAVHWMLKNSKHFQNIMKGNIQNIKSNLMTLFGIAGMERMEYAFPDMLQIYNGNKSLLVSKYRRLFHTRDEFVKRRIELELAIRYSYIRLKMFNNEINEYGSIFTENGINSLLEKAGRFQQYLTANLRKITEDFLNDNDYEKILSKCVCISMKFFSIFNPNNITQLIDIVSEHEESLENLYKCEKDENEIISDIRPLLQNYHYMIIGQLLQIDEGFQEMFKSENGVIYQFKNIIGGDDYLHLFWEKYGSYMHDEEYFRDDLKIQASYEGYFTIKNKNQVKREKFNVEVFILMEWIENFLGKKKQKAFLNFLRGLFRNDLDLAYTLPEISLNLDYKIATFSGKLMDYLKKYAKNLDSKIDDWCEMQKDSIEEILYALNNKEKPKNELSIQMLHVNAMERFALNAKNNIQNDKFNFWKFFTNLHLNPKGIRQIFEFIDIDHVEILLRKLQIKFDRGKLEKYTTDISKSEKRNDEKHIEILVENNESKDEEKSNSIIKINVGKGKTKSNLKNKNKELRDIKIGNEKSQIISNNIKEENKNDDINVNSEKEEKRGRNKTRRGNNLEAKELEIEKQERMNENLMKSLERKEKLNLNEQVGSLSPVKSTRKSEEENINKNVDSSKNISFSSKNRSQIQSNNLDRSINKSIDIWKEYTLDDLMNFETLNMHYNELLKDTNNHEQFHLTDIIVFAFEIGQRLKALEIYTKFWAENKREFEKIRQDAKNLKIDTFKDINKLERALYNLLKKIEIALGNPINAGKDEISDDKEKNIYEMRKQLHGLRFAWIIQNDPNWQNVENKDINHILNALNLEEGTKFYEQIKIWQTIFDQIKLDHELYIERKINENGKEIFDFAKYSQQLWFDDQNKKEEELTESLVDEFKFVDVKDIERGKSIKYLWMRKYMETKERVKKLVKEWHSTAEILFTGSHLLGTMTSRSDMDTIVVTYVVQIYEYNQQAECIIEEIFDDEKKIMQRMRKCENDHLFICKLCKMSHLISAIRIPGSLELVKAFFCEDDNYESESFNKCKYKVKVDFLFATLPNEKDLEKLTSNNEIDEILVKLSKFDRPSYFALTGLRDNFRIIEQIPNDGKNFRIACAALKLWAKRNNIYGPKLGFLKGVHMNLLMAKIYLRYPTASVPFLIEQFFATYILWPWPMPVQLLPISELTYEESRKLDFRGNPQNYLLWYIKEPNAEMPIISPGFFESNKASDVDRFTKSIMRTVMSEGLKQIREIRTGKMEAGKEWYDFMRGHDLAKKYEHFLVVSCFTKANPGILGDDFCEILALKLHDFIPTEIGKILPKEIRWYHIIEAGRREKCLINREGYSDIGNYKCDVWLVGLQPKNNKIINIKMDDTPKLENSMNEASKIMYEDYFKYKQRFNKKLGKQDENDLEGKLHLIINYVGVNELHKWNIQLHGWEIFVK